MLCLFQRFVDGLCLGRGLNPEYDRKQLAAAAVDVQCLGMIAHVAVADHQAPVQALRQVVQLDATPIDAGRLLPALRSFIRFRHGMDVYQEFFEGFATGERLRRERRLGHGEIGHTADLAVNERLQVAYGSFTSMVPTDAFNSAPLVFE